MKITANGISMNYTLDGPAGVPVVTMSHSLATDLSMRDLTLPALGAFRVLRYETRGHGATDAPHAAYTLDQLADDALALLKALGIARTHWVGLSMGGMIGQTLALKAPEVFASLSLCDMSSRVPAEATAPAAGPHQDGGNAGHGAARPADARALVHRAVPQDQAGRDRQGGGRRSAARRPQGMPAAVMRSPR